MRDNGVGVPPELGDDLFAMSKRAHGAEVLVFDGAFAAEGGRACRFSGLEV